MPVKMKIGSFMDAVVAYGLHRYYRMVLFNNGKSQNVLLFDPGRDPKETENIAEEHPEVVARMTMLIRKHNDHFLSGLK
ncbi:hypothetical protein EGM51_15940 [Verrucomicrobia bacterium S94]|nr:hypothetical protein EGM51_15940 [Verrucomicrobia bacterium S94]